jgi:dipeptidyl aminopeptidase/acylaminoacyl peptidase
MKIRLMIAAIFFFGIGHAQLTVEKIMRDPKWIGTSPNNVFWSQDSKTVFFGWNPTQQISDSVYQFTIGTKDPSSSNYLETQKAAAINNGIYNSTYTELTYVYRGDIFLLDLKSNKTIRVTQTEDFESNPKFANNNEWLVYNKNQNLYAWNKKAGTTQQLTNIRTGGENTGILAPVVGVRAVGGTQRAEANAGRATAGVTAGQDQWLQQNNLALSEILRERKQKKEARDAFIKTNKDADTIKLINVGDKQVQALQISPDARFISYRLYTAPLPSKNTIVPDYMAETGYTTDLPGRTKVGNALGKFETWIYDKQRDTVYAISMDSIPGITDVPDYTKDYPQKFANKKSTSRSVSINGPIWNDAGTAAIVDIRSQDNKDRWIMRVNPENGKLSLIDRQRDEAWVGGPGVSGFGANIGWINENQFYYQSEATGYSHLYIYDTKTETKKAITSGKYEVQNVVLSKNKQNFYLLTNEVHPGKQNWYRIKTDGTKKEQITNKDGLYEVSISPDEKWIAYRYSYINKPWELFIQENNAGKQPVQVTNKAMSDSFKAYNWRDTKIFTILSRDGKEIYSRIYEPKPGTDNKAAVIFVHGAGYLQNVHYGWSSYFREQMFNNLLADKGYTVIDIDYRASSGYGRDWRTGIYRFMGGKDLDDEVDAAKWLVENKGIDKNRIGMYGGSYGGFMTLMALFTQPDVFKAGAALRPVTDWAHYNHGYTSNILNEPVNDSIAYAKSSPINFAAGLKNHLLICHGMVDLNVNFQDAVRLSQRLIELGKDNWELAAYPVEDHGFVEPSSWTDEYKRILKLFDTYLLEK